MARQRLFWSISLTVSGIGLMLPALFLSGLPSASREDWDLASAPVARIPLDSLQRTRAASVVFRVPAEDQWARIRRSWGDPGYRICAVTPDPSEAVLPWDSLGIAIVGTTALGPLAMAHAGAFEGATRSTDTSVAFRAKPGEKVRLDVTVRPSVVLPAGELTVAPNWSSNGKGGRGEWCSP
jgi:hypothetical protein